jgi:hypothetical protein
MDWERITLFCFFASYVAALVLELSQLARSNWVTRWLAIGCISAGMVAQTAYLLVRSHNSHLPPLLSSAHDWLLVLSWLAVAMLLAILLWDRQQAIALFALPPIILMVGAARFVSDASDPVLVDLYWWRLLHASLWVVGIAGVVCAFVLSVMYLFQHRRLKQKQTEQHELHLFSLERLTRWNWWCVVVSVPVMTLALATGLYLTWRSQGTDTPVSFWQSGFLLTGLLWLAMTSLFGWLVTRRHPGGRVVAWRTMWACGLLLAVMLLQQIFSRGGIHGDQSSGAGRRASAGTAGATRLSTPVEVLR